MYWSSLWAIWSPNAVQVGRNRLLNSLAVKTLLTLGYRIPIGQMLAYKVWNIKIEIQPLFPANKICNCNKCLYRNFALENLPKKGTKMRNTRHFTPTLEVRTVTGPREGGGRGGAGVHPRASHGRENSVMEISNKNKVALLKLLRTELKTKNQTFGCFSSQKIRLSISFLFQ